MLEGSEMVMGRHISLDAVSATTVASSRAIIGGCADELRWTVHIMRRLETSGSPRMIKNEIGNMW